MASLKIKYRHSSIEGKAGTLFYQVIHNRVARQINSGYKIYPDEWDIDNIGESVPLLSLKQYHLYHSISTKIIRESVPQLALNRYHF